MTPRIVEVDPGLPAIEALISKHLQLMRASSPACSVHAMDADALRKSGARFFAIFDRREAIAMGALQIIEHGHGEIKSMHVRESQRGSGLAQSILSHLLRIAREDGLKRVSLETGSQEAFAPARAFYGRAGFDTCRPFGTYQLDPNSVFMTRIV